MDCIVHGVAKRWAGLSSFHLGTWGGRGRGRRKRESEFSFGGGGDIC